MNFRCRGSVAKAGARLLDRHLGARPVADVIERELGCMRESAPPSVMADAGLESNSRNLMDL